MNCQICGGAMRRKFTRRNFDICRCAACGFMSADIGAAANHVAQIYDDDYFMGGGAGYADYLSEHELIRAHGRRYANLLAKYVAPGRVLDIGAAAGFVLQGFTDAGWTGDGVEPNARLAAHAREKLNLNVTAGQIEDFTAPHKYDLVNLIQVIAHLTDLRRALNVAAEATKADGFWLIETWNRQSLTARAFGENWHEYSPPSVLHWFAPEDVTKLAAQFNFREIARGRPQKWLDGAHAASLLRHKLAEMPAGKLLAPLCNLIPARLPIPYPAEDLFWILLQKHE